MAGIKQVDKSDVAFSILIDVLLMSYTEHWFNVASSFKSFE